MAVNDYSGHEDIIRVFLNWITDEDYGINARLSAIESRYDDGVRLHKINPENFFDFPYPFENVGQYYPFCLYYIDSSGGVAQGNNVLIMNDIGMQIAIYEYERDGILDHLPKRLRRYEVATIRCIEDAYRATATGYSGHYKTACFRDPGDNTDRQIRACVYDGSRYMSPTLNHNDQLEMSVIMRWQIAQARQ